MDDPLRAMRAMQFSARFSMSIDGWTMDMCQDMAASRMQLPKERLWEEWKKWALKGVNPGLGIMNLVKMRWADPAINAMDGVPQDPEWHPEGDVLIHTGHVVNAAAVVADREQLDDNDRLVLMFAALTHDFGKVDTTEMIDGRWRSRGHCEEGVKPAERFLERIGAPKAIITEVLPLIREHLVHAGIKVPSSKAVRRLAKRLVPSSIRMLSMLAESDHSGRPPLPKGNPLSVWEDKANELNIVDEPALPIVKGRDLISAGVKPGKPMGVMIAAALEAQLDGKFSSLEGGLRWLAAEFDLSSHPLLSDGCGDN